MASTTPHLEESPGTWSTTIEGSIDNKTQPSQLVPGHTSTLDGAHTADVSSSPSPLPSIMEDHDDEHLAESQDGLKRERSNMSSSGHLASPQDDKRLARESSNMSSSSHDANREFAPIHTAAASRPVTRKDSRGSLTSSGGVNPDIARILSRRKTDTSAGGEDAEEQAEIERLMSRMFGHARQDNSEEEKTRHVGVIFKNLTVKGVGLGAAIQPTVGDIFAGLPRKIMGAFSGKKKVGKGPPVRTILNDMTGCIKPGEMLLVLGKPGAGCSTFLKVLGNQRAGYKSIDGTVTYGGVDAEAMSKGFRGEVLYNPEDDLHYATLSVKRTLEFALKTRTPGKESRLEGETRKQYVAEFLNNITQLFWISHTLGTKVGDERIRGVSGGEKKRVSIAEAMITKASTQMWDNSTRGLDASTALEYVQSIRSLTNMAGISTAVALYQAGESLYKLFDKVVLIDEGKCCYFGSADDANRYFQDQGFIRPDHWTTADFLTSITDPHARHIKEGWEDRIPRSATQFEEAYRNSEISKMNIRDVEEFESQLEKQKQERDAAMSKATKQKNYTIPFWRQVLACTDRQFFVLWGDQQALVGKWGGILFLSLIIGSTFYNEPKTSAGVFTRGGVLFLMLLFNSLLALAELTSSFLSRPIMLKQKSFSFYRPSAYAIAQVAVDIPLVAVQVSIFDLVVYFMAGLQRTPSQFFISWLILFLSTVTMYSFFRALGALAPSLDVATRFLGLALQAIVTYTGYLIPPTQMHPWLSWLRWINPIQYAFEALLSNEFYNLEIQCVPPMLVPNVPNAQSQYQSCTLAGSQPGNPIVNGADYIFASFEYTRSHLWRNVGIIIAFWIFFAVLTAIGTERQKPNAGGGAVTVFKRGQAPKGVQEAIGTGDAETAHDEEKGKQENGPQAVSQQTSEDGEVPKGIERHETVFTFENVNYIIPYEGGQRQLLKGCDGYVRPGKLTALMGASGAGKTTLLNTLAQRINFGTITGDFLVDGRPLPKSFQRSTGFAEQMDVHEPTATVREAFRFSALLRQPKHIPVEEKYEYCEKIIDLLEMRDIAGATIGEIGNGLAQEQRKRVTIGVELAAKPELLLFLDEPTSGLDSQAAFNIIRFLRKLADAGQAVLCTIHQPSAVLFEQFDELILLKSGGRMVYHGPLGKECRTLLDYFEGNGAKKCPTDMNPAEYQLECIGAGDPNYKGPDWGDTWQKSPQRQERVSEIQEMLERRRNAGTKEELTDDSEYAMPASTQIVAVVKRNFVSYWRTPQYVIGKFALHIITGFFNTFTFWKISTSSADMQQRLFTCFLTLTIAPPLIQQLQPRFIDFRQIYNQREKNSKIYSWFAWTIAAILPELPYSIVAGTVYFNCWYWGVGFHTGSSAIYVWMIFMLFEFYYVGFGMMIASFSPNADFASLLVPVFFIFVIAFCGVLVPMAALPYFWRSWMYWLTPFHYLLEGLLATVTHGVPVHCASGEFARFNAPPGQSCQAYVGPYIARAGGYVQTAAGGMCEFCPYANGDQYTRTFNVYYEHRWRDYGIMWAYVLFNFAMVFLGSYVFLIGGKKIKTLLARRKEKGGQSNGGKEGEKS